MNQIIFAIGFFLLLVGLIFLYKPGLLLWFNQFLREQIFNDSLVLLERRKRGLLFLLVSFLFFYWGYHRAHYCRLRVVDKLVSVDRLLYQSLHHLHSHEYRESKALCERALAKEPDNFEALYQLSASQYLMNDLEEARNSWKKAKQTNSNLVHVERYRNLITRYRNDLASEFQ